jgi:hypothetical protein
MIVLPHHTSLFETPLQGTTIVWWSRVAIFALWYIMAVVVHMTSIHQSELTSYGINLTGVSSKFIEALQVLRQKRRNEETEQADGDAH